MAEFLASLYAHFLQPFHEVVTGATVLPEADSETLCCLLVILCPYIFYFWLWHWPSPFARLSENLGFHPSYLMSYFAHAMKLALFSLLLFYPGAASLPAFLGTPLNALLGAVGGGQGQLSWLQVTTYDLQITWLTLVDIALAAIGQALNSGVYHALGTVGTYYGNRFGDPPSAWATGFPYNLGISDPQYWGSILTVLATLNLMQTRKNPLFQATLLLSYVFMMVVEAKERTPAYVLQRKRKKK